MESRFIGAPYYPLINSKPIGKSIIFYSSNGSTYYKEPLEYVNYINPPLSIL